MERKRNIIVQFILSSLILGLFIFWALNSLTKLNSNPTNQDSKSVSDNAEIATNQNEGLIKPNILSSKKLDISGQDLDKLPSYVVSRTDLEELNISNNQITGALPSEIGKLTKLKVLNASNNLMTGIPAEIGHLPNLEILDLSNNKLTGLPNELSELKKLKVLNLSGNDYSKQDLDIIRKGLSDDVNIIID